MATLISSQSLAAAGTVSSSSTAFGNTLIVTATCIIGAIPPNSQPQVILYLSLDNVNFVEVDRLTFGVAPNQTYYRSFALSDYLGAGDYNNTEYIEALNSSTAALWSNFKVTITGNDTQAVTVSAVD
jgi:phospholipase/lecithinase/hemolysin